MNPHDELIQHESNHESLDHLKGLNAFSKNVAYAAIEAILADEGVDGALIPAPRETCHRAVSALNSALGFGSRDLQRGFFVLSIALEFLPILILGQFRRMTRLSLANRLVYFEKLESSKVGLLSMLIIAFKVPLSVPALEEGNELVQTGFDRPTTSSRRMLPVTSQSESTS